MQTLWRIHWANQVVITTGSSDASATLNDPSPDPFWFMGVTGCSAYINAGAAATTANALSSIGRDDSPKCIKPGTVMHALAVSGGTGQVFFVRAYPVELAG